jgi:hypothetical protein
MIGFLVFLLAVAPACKPNVPVPDIAAQDLTIALDQVIDLPMPVREVLAEEQNLVFNDAYDMTIYDRYQRIEKEQTLCHNDKWYKVCVKGNKIVVSDNKTDKVVKEVELGKVDFVGDFVSGGTFFSVISAEGKLTVLYLKSTFSEKTQKASFKIVKRTYPITELDLGDAKTTIAIRNRSNPFSLWIVSVTKEELDMPLYEIEFVGTDEKLPYIRKLGDWSFEVPEVPVPEIVEAPAAPVVPEVPEVPEEPEIPEEKPEPLGL